MLDFAGGKRSRGCRTKTKDMENEKVEGEEIKYNEKRKGGREEYEVVR
jgi:hypothetical protein